MNLDLNGKVALVTGSTAGIGLAIAKTLAREGATVIINGRSAARVDEARRGVGGNALGWSGDLATAAGAEALLRAHPRVDILINNLGVFESKPLSDVRDEDFAQMFATNVISGARLAQLYLPRMKERDWGRIVFIASETGVNVPADMIPYGVSKAAQIALARGLAETTAGTGITVNSVLPGPTLTEGVERFLDGVPQGEFLQKLRPTSLLKRFAKPEEVAALVAFVASPLSAATNGAALRVEGGLLRGIL